MNRIALEVICMSLIGGKVDHTVKAVISGVNIVKPLLFLPIMSLITRHVWRKDIKMNEPLKEHKPDQTSNDKVVVVHEFVMPENKLITDSIICGYPTGSVDVNNDNWPLIVAERKRLGRILFEDDLKHLLEA